MNLSDLSGRVMALPSLEKRKGFLRGEIEKARGDADSLLKRYEKEKRDVDRIQKDSFSTFLLRLTGKYEDKLEKEQMEEINAKLDYDRAVTHLNNLLAEEKELDGRLSALREEERKYRAELDSRRRRLADCAGYAEFEKEKQDIISRMTEINEAIRAVDRTKRTARKILKSLDSAKGWATFDAFTKGGIISHIAKYSHIDSAEGDFHTLSSRLRELRPRLNDVEGLSISGFVGE